MKPLLSGACALAFLSSTASAQTIFWDNGAPDGSNGYSNTTINGFGIDRTLLDDFQVPSGETWDIACLTWNHIWNLGAGAGYGTGTELSFQKDAGGVPGGIFTTPTITGYSDVTTGNVYFSRPEVVSSATFAAVSVGTGTYWIENAIEGGDNNFWLILGAVQLSECWVDYADLGTYGPGSSLFGVQADLAFQLKGAADFGSKYCDESQNPNNSADISLSTDDSSSPSILVSLSNGPPGQFCYLLVGDNTGTVSQPPGAKGDLCVAGGNCLGRYDKDIGQIDSAGNFKTDIQNPISKPCNGGVIIAPGSTWAFQYWHRQSGGQPATFSEAVKVQFQ